MKYFYFLFLIALSTIAYAQNWSPIQTNEKMNYQHSDSTYISHTIWVDSIDLTGPDTSFFLNRIVKNHPTDIDKALRNQAQFIFKAMNKLNDGIYHFTDPGYYIIKTWASTGDSWLFDPDNNLQATVSGVSQNEILGVIDSVKAISLSDGSEIILSKSFGIIQFPDFENEGFYELVGIQDSEYGLSIPGFWEVYDFEVGDVFQYSEDSYIPETWWTEKTIKFTITSKEEINNSYNYTIEGLSYAVPFWGPPQYYTINEDLIFLYSDNHPSNKFPGQIYIFPVSTNYDDDSIYTVSKVLYDPVTGLVSKHFGAKEESQFPYEHDVFYELNASSDTIYRFEYVSMVGDPCGLMGIGVGETVGETYRSEGCFEYQYTKNLVGYIKDGDTVGTITPDSLLFVSTNSKAKIEKNILLFPNPVKEKMLIKFLSFNEVNNPSIELMTLTGEPIKSFKLNYTKSTISFSGLPNGIYIYSIKSGNEILKRGKIVKQ